MPSYAASSQRSRWTWASGEALEGARAQARSTALAAAGAPDTEAASADEERALRRFYLGKIREVCGALRHPAKVCAAACALFQRFFTKESVLVHEPKAVMLTCVYLAGKVEEHYIDAEELAKGLRQDPQVVLRRELAVLEGLGFDLLTHPPHRALAGFVHDADARRASRSLAKCEAPAEWAAACRDAERYLDDLLVTDALLLHPPGRLALAALRDAGRKAGPAARASAEAYVALVIGEQGGGDVSVLDAVDALRAEALTPPDVAAVTEVDRKIKLFRSNHPPPSDDKARKAQANAAKRVQEAAAAKRAQELAALTGDDPDPSPKRRKSAEHP